MHTRVVRDCNNNSYSILYESLYIIKLLVDNSIYEKYENMFLWENAL